MARCGSCGGQPSKCRCVIVDDPGGTTIVHGTGDPSYPYFIEATAGDDVWVGDNPPDPVDGSYDLWVDIGSVPPVLMAKLPSGEWVKVSSESVDEVWVNNDQPTDPLTELWVDLDDVSATTAEQEVAVSNSQPRAGALTELWVDTGELPGKLKYNDPLLGWQTIAGGENEIYVGETDPFAVSPDASSELWYDTNAVARAAPKKPERTGGTSDEAWEELVALRKRVTVLEAAITTMLRGN